MFTILKRTWKFRTKQNKAETLRIIYRGCGWSGAILCAGGELRVGENVHSEVVPGKSSPADGC